MCAKVQLSSRLFSKSIRHRGPARFVRFEYQFSTSALCFLRETFNMRAIIARVPSKRGPPGISPLLFNPEEALPPRLFLSSAYKSGALSIPPDSATQFLRQYARLKATNAKHWEAGLIEEHRLDGKVMHMLAQITQKASMMPAKMLAKMLMHSASSMGHTPATLHLLNSTLLTGNLERGEYVEPLRRLRLLVKQGLPGALLLQGKIYEREGRDDDALKLFENVTSSGYAETGTEASANEEKRLQDQSEAKGALAGYEMPEALLLIGKLRLRRGQEGMAIKAFMKAALEENFAPAYYELALLTADVKKKEEYTLKAAQSGVIEACHKLGTTLLENKKPEDVEMAKEWLYISGSAGIRQSALELGHVFEKEGDELKAKQWYELAAEMQVKEGYTRTNNR